MRCMALMVCFFIVAMSVCAQHLPAYQIYNDQGKRVSFAKMVRKLTTKDIILFGEIHDNPIDHWLQLELVKALHEKGDLILGAEMFESEDQEVLDSYLRGDLKWINQATSIDLWPNYATDYAPLVEFAQRNGLPFIATNVPDRFAKEVYFSGFSALDSVQSDDLRYLAPLPIPFDKQLKTYQDIFELWPDHASDELIMAQALRDATMAHLILTNFKAYHLFLHINGTYHSEWYEGILWYLMQYRDDLTYATIATVEQASVRPLSDEYKGVANFIICVDEEMTETH
ncbi:MAG: ChaN family lipoprotein [Saprospiraceae bacterium]|nr:ChaN family lipoprotein [Saprospiraceae bacterium]